MTKHKNLDSLKHYLSAPTYKEKQNYNEALLNYAENDKQEEQVPPKRRRTKPNASKTKQPNTSAKAPVMEHAPNIDPENCLVPMFPENDENDDKNITYPVASQHSNVVNQMNQMRQASNMFQSATFHNCNFTFQMPK